MLRNRDLGHQRFVYLWLDATYVHVREAGQVTSKAVVIATGLRADGYREVLGVDVGDSENETFWTEFLRGLKDRNLTGVRLVVSDAHAGLKAAIRRVFQGSGWQRCRVHAMRIDRPLGGGVEWSVIGVLSVEAVEVSFEVVGDAVVSGGFAGPASLLGVVA